MEAQEEVIPKMKNNDARMAMVDNQIRPADVTRYEILEAFLTTPRERFVPENKSYQAYGEYQIDLGQGREMATPRSFAKLVQAAKIRSNEDILLIGANLGYEAAILSQIGANVVAIEDREELGEDAQERLTQNGFDNAIVLNAPLNQGYAKDGPYQVLMIVGVVNDLPDEWLEQLSVGGRAIYFKEHAGVSTAFMTTRTQSDFSTARLFDAVAPRFTAFTHDEEFCF